MGAAVACTIAIVGRTGLLERLIHSSSLAPIAVIIAAATAIHSASSMAYVPRLFAARAEAAWSRASWLTVGASVVLVPSLTNEFGITGTAAATLLAYAVNAVLLNRAFTTVEINTGHPTP
jgi:O-antigen/teichoic acid export membrane protein